MSDRPRTAGGPFSQTFPDQEAQQGMYDLHPLDEDEESDVEDVFAFLPPDTADGQQAQTQAHDSETPSQPPGVPRAPDTTESDVFAPALSTQIEPPQPVYYPYPPSSTFLESPPHGTPSLPPSYSFSPMTPPSTESQGDLQEPSENTYRLRRISSVDSTHNRNPPIPPSPEIQVSKGISHSAPNTSTGAYEQGQSHKKMRAKTEDGSGRKKKRGKSAAGEVVTNPGSRSITPSMLEEDSVGSIKMGFDLGEIEEEDSPYPEVRASVSNMDDPEMPTLTFRMWMVGLVLCLVSGAANVFFTFRAPAPTIYPLVLLLISYPIGKFLAYSLPITTYRISTPFRPITFSLNPGPWSIKEHVLVYIMANVAISPPYAMNAIVVVEVFYGLKLGYWFNLNLVLATQLTGFGLAGLCRRFLVWPASMVWPQNLVACALLNTLHAEDDDPKGGLTRYRFYIIVSVASFFFFFLPGFLFTALSVFSFVCWIAPQNVVLNQLFGVYNGLGMSVITFDWTQIVWVGSPLMVPWWAEVHVFAGFVLFYWILTPILYYTNVWQLSHFPIAGNVPYDRFGKKYDIKRVITPNLMFNETAYREYSPLYLPAAYAITYLLAFAMSTNVIVHTLIYHGRTLWNGFKRIQVEEDDIHAKLMRYYPEVPDWWYLFAFVGFFSLAIVAVEVWHTGVAVWLLLLSVALPALYILPGGFIFAMTGQGIQVNLLAQIIPGTLAAGNPLANMFFKAYAVQTLIEAQSFVQDLKLGHYIKVPPRATFLVQLIATTVAAFVQVGAKTWLFENVHDICTDGAKDALTCPHNQVFFTASAVWGLIGPTRQFGRGSLYYPQLYAIIIGAALPIPFWLWQRRYPHSWIKYVSTPVLLNGPSYIPPATGINYSSWFAIGFIFQYWIRTRNFAWWSKFNYITSAAMDSGTVISLIVIFFTLQFPKGGVVLNWWGNTVWQQTADYKRLPLRPIPSGEALPWPS